MKLSQIKRSGITYVILSFILGIVLLAGCQSKPGADIAGRWAVIGEDRVLEFTEDGYYNVYLGGESIFSNVEGYGKLRYKIDESNDSLYLLITDENFENNFLEAFIDLNDDQMNMVTFTKTENGSLVTDQETVLQKE